MTIRPVVHTVLHFAVPGLVARLGYKKDFFRAWAVMVATMLVDLDHLLADPVFNPDRCSIGFHPLHSVPAIGFYVLMTFVPRSATLRLIGLGLMIHMGLDWTDCVWMGWG
ncbi:hypothetical protein DENIS_2694 [Desulfonema ishimotonii]|uniref:Metal-dependent hydrolase n=2 Tax=Desulfonema ishimotonii TaxID=45657 RepID=A0A401FXJ9_9BACT|nr:hypothetical protein DENIS_2694 [Desulfonema ishimotonii]